MSRGIDEPRIDNKGTVFIYAVKLINGNIQDYEYKMEPGSQVFPKPVTKDLIFNTAINIQLEVVWLLLRNEKLTADVKDLESIKASASSLKDNLNDDLFKRITTYISIGNVHNNFLLDFNSLIATITRKYNASPRYYADELALMHSISDEEKSQMQQLLFNVVHEALTAPKVTFFKYLTSDLLQPWDLPTTSSAKGQSESMVHKLFSFTNFTQNNNNNWCTWMKQRAVDACCNKRKKLKSI
jgi:hypothetical protein